MNYSTFLLQSKGFYHLIYRLFSIFMRFGFTNKKIAKNLYNIFSIVNNYRAGISLNITAIVLDRHPSLIRDLSEKGIEFGAHGYVHTNYNTLSLSKQTEDFKKAQEVFERNQIPLCGFRAPYLSFNNDTLEAIKECGFLWSSNQVIDWNVLDKEKFKAAQWKTYQKVLLELYKAKSADNYQSLPKINGHYVEIPVSIPDDEIMVDRLRIKDKSMIEAIWHEILKRSQERGELFTVQLHHERFNYFKPALESLLKQASEPESKVWLANLKQIAEWWKEKDTFKCALHDKGNQKYHVQCHCSERATILVKNPTPSEEEIFYNNYTIRREHDFMIESPVRPCIGVSPNAPRELLEFLNEEGFVAEVDQNKENYGLYLDNDISLAKNNEVKLLSLIENSSSPLIRFWRWPEEHISALSITGDIDSITLWDFFARVYEF